MPIYRYNTLDFFKTISAFAVVCIHTTYLGCDFIKPLARFAVPFFFMVSGYFLYGASINSIERKLKKITYILLWSSTLYVLFYLRFQMNGDFFVDPLMEIINFIFFCYYPFASHLWYIGAYIYVLLAIWLIERYHLWNIFFYFIPLLLIINLVLGAYSEFLFDTPIPLKYTRNAWLTGLPFVGIGAFIKQQESFITSCKLRLVAIVIAIACFLTETEVLFLIKKTTMDLYLSTILLSISIFIFALRFKTNKENPLVVIGQKYCLYIYIYHPIVIWGVAVVVEKVNSKMNYLTHPIIVFFITLVSIYLLQKQWRIAQQIFTRR